MCHMLLVISGYVRGCTDVTYGFIVTLSVTASFQQTSYQCVTSYATSLSIVLRHPLNIGIELAV
jgi:hypothetical protein